MVLFCREALVNTIEARGLYKKRFLETDGFPNYYLP
jgi:hypothetical protein